MNEWKIIDFYENIDYSVGKPIQDIWELRIFDIFKECHMCNLLPMNLPKICVRLFIDMTVNIYIKKRHAKRSGVQAHIVLFN